MSGYDIWILGYGTWILWCDFIHWWNDTLRSQYSIVMWWCVIIMTKMLFNIEYCIIDLSDYEIKIGKTSETVRSQDLAYLCQDIGL